MVPTLTPVLDRFSPNDDVRLILHHQGVRPGTRGRIVGFYARFEDPTYLVSFESEPGCTEVRPDEIALAG